VEKGSLKDVPDAPEKLKDLFATALEVPAERHLQIQAAFQRHVDNSVSKTINLPQDATPNGPSSWHSASAARPDLLRLRRFVLEHASRTATLLA
jgi:ribonucleotide reductase alpha subunit